MKFDRLRVQCAASGPRFVERSGVTGIVSLLTRLAAEALKEVVARSGNSSIVLENVAVNILEVQLVSFL